MRIKWNTDNPPSPKTDNVTYEEYLVTYESGGLDIATWTNANRFWAGHTTDWHWNCAQYCNVVAWMCLPEPYKKEPIHDCYNCRHAKRMPEIYPCGECENKSCWEPKGDGHEAD